MSGVRDPAGSPLPGFAGGFAVSSKIFSGFPVVTSGPAGASLVNKERSYMNLSRRSLLSAFAILPSAAWLRGQQTPPAQSAAPVPAGQQMPPAQGAAQVPPGQQPPTYTAEVKVVNIFATVRDKKGQIVKDLNKEDFVLDE